MGECSTYYHARLGLGREQPVPTIERDGVKVYYEVAGEGPAVLLSHGYSATADMWRDQVAALSGSYKVIIWDMRGHGRSDCPEDDKLYSEALTVEDMAAILDACGVESAVIGGLSLGGYMSLAFHLKYPERVNALMLFDTGPGYKSDAGRDAWNETAMRWVAAFEARGLAALSEIGSREMRNEAHRSADGLIRAAKGMLRQFDSRVIESLPEIAVPTLVLVGADDTNFIAPTDYMAKKIPNATKVVLAGAGHAANLDRPEDFNAAVREFLKHVD